MKRRETLHHNMVHSRGGRLIHTFPSIALVLSLGLGSIVSGGCVAVPAVMMTSAAVTAVAVVSEGEKLVQNPDTENSLMVRNEADGDSSPGKACERQGALQEEDQPGPHEQQEVRSHCAADLHEPEAVGEPNHPKT